MSFNRDVALGQAMLLFWRHGYESTSLRDLREVMGVTSPSIYAAFGDKKQLFREAVRRYLGDPVTFERIIASATSARDAAMALLDGAVIGFTGADTPAGCLLATATISCSADAADVQGELAAIRGAIETQLRTRIESEVQNGEMPQETDAEALAAHVMAVIQGLSTLARDGAPRDKLVRVARSAMRAWPSGPPQCADGSSVAAAATSL